MEGYDLMDDEMYGPEDLIIQQPASINTDNLQELSEDLEAQGEMFQVRQIMLREFMELDNLSNKQLKELERLNKLIGDPMKYEKDDDLFIFKAEYK